MGRNTGGNPGDVRKSALWGSGNRGGEHRSNALWGKGGRGFVMTVLVIALALPLAAGAGSGSGKNEGVVPPGGTYVSAELKELQRAHPNELVDVIVMADEGVSDNDAKKAEHELKKLERRFDLIKGFAGQIRAKDLEKLAKYKGLSVTANAAIQAQDLLPTVSDVAPTSSQLWTYQTGTNKLWTGAKSATIAIVDSGIDASRADFKGRVKAQVGFVTSASANAAGDGRVDAVTS